MIVNSISCINNSQNLIFKNCHLADSFVLPIFSSSDCNFDKYDSACSNINISFINFKGRKPKKLIEMLPPITSFDEYKKIMTHVANSKTTYGEKFWSLDSEHIKYRKLNPQYYGLLPYCGNNDVSYYINRYLGNMLNKDVSYTPSEETVCDIIRALDYSLGCLDDEFGKYQGIVFRKGYFGTKPVQYASTSKRPAIASSFNGFDIDAQYSVIRVKSAHKICDFQRKIHSSYAMQEAEILIDRHAKHRLLKADNYDEELMNAKEELAKFMCLDYSSAFYLPKINNSIKKRILSKIKVYEEI